MADISGQTRLFVETDESTANIMLDVLSLLFEEDGHALATSEIDETLGLWQLSVYAPREDEAVISQQITRAWRDQTGTAVTPSAEPVADIDWVAKSLEGLQPVRAGQVLIHGAHDRNSVRVGDLAIEIDAGQAFGTGHHGTTIGCLDMIQAILKCHHPARVLDLGTGSGVLAIALARLRPDLAIVASDNDPVATATARQNARLNHVARHIRFVTAHGLDGAPFATMPPFDLIVANILAGPLMRLAPRMATSLKPGGSLILSGILAAQRRKVIAAYVNQRFSHVKTLWRDGWVTLHFKSIA